MPSLEQDGRFALVATGDHVITSPGTLRQIHPAKYGLTDGTLVRSQVKSCGNEHTSQSSIIVQLRIILPETRSSSKKVDGKTTQRKLRRNLSIVGAKHLK